MASCAECSSLKGVLKKKTAVLKSKVRLLSVYKSLIESTDFKSLKAKKCDKTVQCCLEDEKAVDDVLMYHVSQNEKYSKEIQKLRELVSDYERKLPSSEDRAKHLDFINKQLVSYHRENEIALENFRRNLKSCAKAVLKHEPKNSRAKSCLEFAKNIGKRDISVVLKDCSIELYGDQRLNELLSPTLKSSSVSPAYSLHSESSGFGSEADCRAVSSHSSNDSKEGYKRLSKTASKGSLPNIFSPYSVASQADSVIDSEDDIDNILMKSPCVLCPSSKSGEPSNTSQPSGTSEENEPPSQDISHKSPMSTPYNSSNSSDPKNFETAGDNTFNQSHQDFDFENFSELNKLSESVIDTFLNDFNTDVNNAPLNSGICTKNDTSSETNKLIIEKPLESAQFDYDIFDKQDSLNTSQTKHSNNSALPPNSVLNSDISLSNLTIPDISNQGIPVKHSQNESIFENFGGSDSPDNPSNNTPVHPDLPLTDQKDQHTMDAVNEISIDNQISIEHFQGESQDDVIEIGRLNETSTSMVTIPYPSSSTKDLNASKDQQTTDTKSQDACREFSSSRQTHNVSSNSVLEHSDSTNHPSRETLIDSAVDSEPSLYSDISTKDQPAMDTTNNASAEKETSVESVQREDILFEKSDSTCIDSGKSNMQPEFPLSSSRFFLGTCSVRDSVEDCITESVQSDLCNGIAENLISNHTCPSSINPEISLSSPIPIMSATDRSDLDADNEANDNKLTSGDTENINSLESSNYLLKSCTYINDHHFSDQFTQSSSIQQKSTKTIEDESSNNSDIQCTKHAEKTKSAGSPPLDFFNSSEKHELNTPVSNKLLKTLEKSTQFEESDYKKVLQHPLRGVPTKLFCYSEPKRLLSSPPCSRQIPAKFSKNHKQLNVEKTPVHSRLNNMNNIFSPASSIRKPDGLLKPPSVKINSQLNLDPHVPKAVIKKFDQWFEQCSVKQEVETPLKISSKTIPMGKINCCCEVCPFHLQRNTDGFVHDSPYNALWKPRFDNKVKETEKVKKNPIVPVFPSVWCENIDVGVITDKLKALSFSEILVKESNNLFSEAIKDLNSRKQNSKFSSVHSSKFTSSEDPAGFSKEFISRNQKRDGGDAEAHNSFFEPKSWNDHPKQWNIQMKSNSFFSSSLTNNSFKPLMPNLERKDARCFARGAKIGHHNPMSINYMSSRIQNYNQHQNSLNKSSFVLPLSKLCAAAIFHSSPLTNQNNGSHANSADESISDVPQSKLATDIVFPDTPNSQNNDSHENSTFEFISEVPQPKLTIDEVFPNISKSQNDSHENSFNKSISDISPSKLTINAAVFQKSPNLEPENGTHENSANKSISYVPESEFIIGPVSFSSVQKRENRAENNHLSNEKRKKQSNMMNNTFKNGTIMTHDRSLEISIPSPSHIVKHKDSHYNQSINKNRTDVINTHPEKNDLTKELEFSISSSSKTKQNSTGFNIMENSSLYMSKEDKVDKNSESENHSVPEITEKTVCSKTEINQIDSSRICMSSTLNIRKHSGDEETSNLENEGNSHSEKLKTPTSKAVDIQQKNSNLISSNSGIKFFKVMSASESEENVKSDKNTMDLPKRKHIFSNVEGSSIVNKTQGNTSLAHIDCEENSSYVEDSITPIYSIVSKKFKGISCKTVNNKEFCDISCDSKNKTHLDKLKSSESPCEENAEQKNLHDNDIINQNTFEEAFPFPSPKRHRISHFSSMNNESVQRSNLPNNLCTKKSEVKSKKSEKEILETTSKKSSDNEEIEEVEAAVAVPRRIPLVSKSKSLSIKSSSTQKDVSAPVTAVPTFKIPNEKPLKKQKKRKGKDAKNMCNEEDLKLLDEIFLRHRIIEILSPLPPSPQPLINDRVSEFVNDTIKDSESCSPVPKIDTLNNAYVPQESKVDVPSENVETAECPSESRNECTSNVCPQEVTSETLLKTCSLAVAKVSIIQEMDIKEKEPPNSLSTLNRVHSPEMIFPNTSKEQKVPNEHDDNDPIDTENIDEYKLQNDLLITDNNNDTKKCNSPNSNDLKKPTESISSISDPSTSSGSISMAPNIKKSQESVESSKRSFIHDRDIPTFKEEPNSLSSCDVHVFSDSVSSGGDGVPNATNRIIAKSCNKNLSKNEISEQINNNVSIRKSNIVNSIDCFIKSEETVKLEFNDDSKFSDFGLSWSSIDNQFNLTSCDYSKPSPEFQSEGDCNDGFIPYNNEKSLESDFHLYCDDSSYESASAKEKSERKLINDHSNEENKIMETTSENLSSPELKINFDIKENTFPSDDFHSSNKTASKFYPGKHKISTFESMRSKIPKLSVENCTSTSPATHKVPQIVPDYCTSLQSLQSLKKKSNPMSPTGHCLAQSFIKSKEKSLLGSAPETSELKSIKENYDENKNLGLNLCKNENSRNCILPVFRGFYNDLSAESAPKITGNTATDINNDGSSCNLSTLESNVSCVPPSDFINNKPINDGKRKLDEPQNGLFNSLTESEPQSKKLKTDHEESTELLECTENIFCFALKHFMTQVPIDNDEPIVERNSIIKEQNLEKEQIKRYFLKVLGASSEDLFLVVNRVITSMKQDNELVVNPKPFSRAVFDIISTENGGVVRKRPFMTKTVLSCTVFTMAYVGREANSFLLEVLREVEEVIGAYYDKTLSLTIAIKLISYYTVLCKAYDLEARAKNAIVDVLYSRPAKCYGIILKMLQIWPQLLVNQNQYINEDCVLTQTILFLLLCTAKDAQIFRKPQRDAFQSIYHSTGLKNYLKFKYNYTHQNIGIERTKILEKALQRITEEASKKALVILNRFEGAGVSITLIKSNMLPLLRQWIDGKLLRAEALEVMTTTAIIVRGFPGSTSASFVPQILDLFEEILHKSPDEYFTERVIEAIGFLRRHNIMMCAMILMRFTPPSQTITKKTMTLVRKILSAQEFSNWIKAYKKFQVVFKH